MLSDRIQNGTGFYEQKRQLPTLKNSNKYLGQVHSQVLQDVVLRLDKACQAFLVGLSNFPRFKRKGRYNSFTYPQSGFWVEKNHVRLSKIGRIRARVHCAVEGTIKRATVFRDIDQWFFILLAPEAASSKISGTGAIGVDLGITSVLTLSNGSQLRYPDFISKSTQKVRTLQLELARKRRGSRNYQKARLALARSWRKVRRQRSDFAGKISDRLTQSYGVIVFEDLEVRKMVKNHNLASAIMDSAWGRLCELTASKAEARGGRVVFVNPSGTSQKCSGCGELVRKNLSQRTHKCQRCGLTIDRDVNAARNILERGLEQARAEAKPLLVQRMRISKFRR